MNPHKLSVQICVSVIVVFLSAEICVSKQLGGTRIAIVVDERLAALRQSPNLNGNLIRRLSRGRLVAIRGSKTTADGVVFLLVNVTTRTHGWIQREAVVSPGRPGDDRRVLDLINASNGFDRIARTRIFLDHFPRSPLRPQVLLLLSFTAEEQAAKLSRDATKRLSITTTSAPEFTYFLNYTGLDRFNRQRVKFVFDKTTKRFHYDGAALRELVRRYPKTPEAATARSHLTQLALISQ